MTKISFLDRLLCNTSVLTAGSIAATAAVFGVARLVELTPDCIGAGLSMDTLSVNLPFMLSHAARAVGASASYFPAIAAVSATAATAISGVEKMLGRKLLNVTLEPTLDAVDRSSRDNTRDNTPIDLESRNAQAVDSSVAHVPQTNKGALTAYYRTRQSPPLDLANGRLLDFDLDGPDHQK